MLKHILSLLILLSISFYCLGQTDTLGKPIYKCKAFKYDTIAEKITFKKECVYFLYSAEDKFVIKKGWGKMVDVVNLKSGLYCYLYLRKEENNTNPHFEEVKKNGYLIRIK